MSDKKSMSDFFSRKKKKTAVKSSNLNEDNAAAAAAPAAKGKARKDENWKEDEPPAEAASPKQRAVTNLADIQEEEAESLKKAAKTWGSAKAGAGGASAANTKYSVPMNQPGTVTDRKFPTLGVGLVSSAVDFKKGDKARVTAATNAFANLDVADDSEDEDDRLARPALVSKEKGAKVHEGKKKEEEDEEEEPESKRKERLEKERRKKEREEEKKMEREQNENAVEEKFKAKKAAAAPVIVSRCDPSKFLYGNFDVDACAEKYTHRQKMPLLEVVMA